MLKPIGKIGFLSNSLGGGKSNLIRFRINPAYLDTYPEEGIDYGTVSGSSAEFLYYEFGHAEPLATIDLSLCTFTVLDSKGILLFTSTLDALYEIQLYRNKIYPIFTLILNIGGEITENLVEMPEHTSIVIFSINVLNVT